MKFCTYRHTHLNHTSYISCWSSRGSCAFTKTFTSILSGYPIIYFSCWSYVGRTSYVAQEISIGSGCEYKGVVMHELLHALGFYHEQSRYDRDDFVKILFENVQAGKNIRTIAY